MVKALTSITRRPGTSVAAFQEHWRTRHADVVVKLNRPRPPRPSASAPRTRADEPNFLDTARLPIVITREHVVVG